MPPFKKIRTLDHLSFTEFDRALRPRRRRPRPSIPPDGDRYFLTAEELRKLLGHSSYYFFRKVLSLPTEHNLPPVLALGPDGVTDYRFRADDVYRLYPHLDPHRNSVTGETTDWLTRFKAKARVDHEAYLAAKNSAKEPSL